MSDPIPGPDDEFDTYAVDQFGPYANNNQTALGISAEDLATLNTQLVRWGYAWPGFISAEAAYHAATDEKKTVRGTLTSIIRIITGKVQLNLDVTDAMKELLGVTVRKTTRTPSPVPSTVPALQRFDTSVRGMLRMFVVDATTPETRAKPPGVHSCEIRDQVVGTQPVNPNSMPFLATVTRMPHSVEFEAEEIGQNAYFAFRWLNTRGEHGPWSQVYAAMVPG